MGRLHGAASAGFTLIEAMISMFFVAFIVGELAMVSGYAARSSSYARRITEANMLAEGVLEKSRNTAYTNLNTRFSTLDTPADPIMFDLTKDGILENYSEVCDPAAPNTATVVTTCTCSAGGYTIVRTISPVAPATTTPFSASIGAAVDVVVSWTASERVGGVQTAVVKDVKVSTVRSKF